MGALNSDMLCTGPPARRVAPRAPRFRPPHSHRDRRCDADKSARGQPRHAATSPTARFISAHFHWRKSVPHPVTEYQSLLRVLASVGAQMAAFVHEISALLGAAQTVEQAIEQTVRDDGHLTIDQRRVMRRTLAAAIDLRRGLERHASYLVDVVTPDARRRRARQRLADRYDAAVRLVQQQADRRGIEIENRIPTNVKSPPMFSAEMTTVFGNLLTNAVKAVGKNGRVCATAKTSDRSLRVRIQNTGARVDIENAERWFRPFESTTWRVDPVLGQGMGLGLPITRNVLASYGATISFVEPDGAYSTAVEIVFPT